MSAPTDIEHRSQLNETHNPERRSWVASANARGTDFPLQNLPFGVFTTQGRDARGGVAIGDYILDLREALTAKLFSGSVSDVARAAAAADLSSFVSLGPSAASALRARLFEMLCEGDEGSSATRAKAERLLVPRPSATLLLPLTPRSFTDFCTSLHHIERMGRGRPPHPAWARIPVAYNGRSSSVRESGYPVRRPCGQFAAAGEADAELRLRAEPNLDFELELGAWLCADSTLGEPMTLDAADQSIFGYCLVNDWSARAIQYFEMALGPFLGKSFLTTISPWIVSAEALLPFRARAPLRTPGQPAVPSHLQSEHHAAFGGAEIELTASLQTSSMRRAGIAARLLTRTNTEHLHWTFAQMICHQTTAGGNLCSGDLVASGTVSGPSDQSRACFAELNEGGRKELELPGGEHRMWLGDGDEIVLRGRARRAGFVSIGFGECSGRVEPALCLGR